ncbi:hypothetical protein A0H81_06666 [Grifola frondosa]|uniref:Uncharacterized protein n=1 Tax=Grifola frondosa TaxID=5627 RepID=A0A1C7M9B6_GRIFR|nr:hypothetical protein A0H81_06666 [Grifola frondosa]
MSDHTMDCHAPSVARNQFAIAEIGEHPLVSGTLPDSRRGSCRYIGAVLPAAVASSARDTTFVVDVPFRTIVGRLGRQHLVAVARLHNKWPDSPEAVGVVVKFGDVVSIGCVPVTPLERGDTNRLGYFIRSMS